MTGPASLVADGDRQPARAAPSVAIGYLRAAVVLMVLAQHAMLAYHPFAPPLEASLAAEPRTWRGFPIVDRERSTAVLLLTTFDDIFGMALLFFLSGLFVCSSLARKGPRRFLHDRLVRLGIPFAVSAVLVPPLAYYPSYLVTSAHPSVADFCRVWLSMGVWPGAAGPAWFLWVLLAFDLVAAVLLARVPGTGARLRRLGVLAGERPAAFFWRLVVVSTCTYLPLALAVGPGTWSTWGPFTLQTSRVLHYLVYFLAGAGVGTAGIERGLLAPAGRLARRWAAWGTLSLAAFCLAGTSILAGLQPGAPQAVWAVVVGVACVVSCAASSLAVIAVFVRFVHTRGRVFDSLDANAYGMYLVHFPLVCWLQYALLPYEAPAVAKCALVILGTVTASWAASAAVRRVPGVARVL